MTAEEKRDIRFCILRELFRVQPRGRTVRGLYTLIAPNVPSAQPESVEEQTKYLAQQGFLATLPVDELATSDELFYVITRKGRTYCQEKQLV
jgi:hypothetical protein